MSALVTAVAALAATGTVTTVVHLAVAEGRSTGRQVAAWNRWEADGHAVPGWHPVWLWSTDQVWRARTRATRPEPLTAPTVTADPEPARGHVDQVDTELRALLDEEVRHVPTSTPRH